MTIHNARLLHRYRTLESRLELSTCPKERHAIRNEMTPLAMMLEDRTLIDVSGDGEPYATVIDGESE